MVGEPDALAEDGLLGRTFAGVHNPLIVVDRGMLVHHRDRVDRFVSSLQGANVIALKGGEGSKTLTTALEVVASMDQAGLPRRSAPIVAVGGGVVCDVVGFAASIYRRGIPYVRIPTTLLSQVDVSVAIKTGVNHCGFRNRLGSFWAPRLTLIDRSFVGTQARGDIAQGLGEIVKLALICSEPLFAELEEMPESWSAHWFAASDGAAELLAASINVMGTELASNLWEDRLDRAVDFGHTFSPFVEMSSGLHHGFAVALDCLLSTSLAIARGLADEAVRNRLLDVMLRCALPTRHYAFEDVDLLWASLQDATRHRDGRQHLPVPTAVGSHVFLEDVSRGELAASVSELRGVVGKGR